MIPIVHNNEALFQHIKDAWQKSHGLRLYAASPKEIEEREGPIFLLEPFPLRPHLLSYSNLWLKYLQADKKKCKRKLLVIGDQPFTGEPNYFYMFQFPQDIKGSIEHALPAADLRYFPRCGEITEELLFQQIRGHGKFSMYKSVEKFALIFQWVDSELYNGATWEEVESSYLSQIKLSELEELEQRWETYLPFYAFLPWALQITPFTPTIKHLKDYYTKERKTKGMYDELNLKNSFWKLKDLLKKLQHFFGS